MSEKEIEQVVEEEDVAVEQVEDLDEKKASFGDPSEVPDPIAKTAKAPHALAVKSQNFRYLFFIKKNPYLTK